MKATWNEKLLAEADKKDLIFIEGNWYFPPDSLKQEFFLPSETHTKCSWKGEASYFNVSVDGQTNEDAAWFYPDPMKTAFVITKKDFSNYVAFWRGVEVQE